MSRPPDPPSGSSASQRRRDLLATALALVAVAAASALSARLAAAQGSRSAEYEIGAGDVLSVVVIGQAPMTGSFPVDAEGMLNLPILGKVKAAQHTTLELERKLTTLLADGILRRPQVTVSVAEYGSQRVFVTGEVQRPGRYPLKSDRTLLALLGDIGALGPNVGHEVIVVRPPAAAAEASGPEVPLSLKDPALPPAAAPDEPSKDSDVAGTETATPPAPPAVPGLPFVAPGSEVFRVSLLELQSGNPARNIPLQAGDTVYFPRASQVYVMGSVARPGPYKFNEGMTVLQVLTLAGGVTERGSQGRAKVVRIVDGKKVEKKVKATDLVLPEDTLIVPERFF